MTEKNTIILIGGGIGGAATALALHRARIEFVVYERLAALREAGAGVALWANATRALKSLGLLEVVLQQSDPITNYQFFSDTGEALMDLRTDGFDTPAVAIHRADLLALLLKQLPQERLHLGHTFERFVHGLEAVHVHFADGESTTGAALIGADGLRSRVRAQLLQDARPNYCGMTSYRGLTKYIPKTYTRGHVREFLGAGRAFGFVTIGKGQMYWYVATKSPEGQPDAPQGRKSTLLGLFRKWSAPIVDLIDATEESSILKTDLYDRVSIPDWGRQNVTLLGDAAHPTLPTMGQGACMAIEDALIVTQCLSQNPDDPASAFRQYEKIRYPRTKKIVEQSARIGKVAGLENRLVATLRNTAMKWFARQFERDYVSLHAYRAEFSLESH